MSSCPHPAMTDRSRLPPGRFATEAGGGERGFVVAPDPLLVRAQMVEVLPAIYAGVVQIVELDAQRIVADRLELEDADMTAAEDQGLAARSMALHLRRRTLDPEQLGREPVALAVVEVDLEHLLFPLQADFDGPMLGPERLGHRGLRHEEAPQPRAGFTGSSSSERASSTSMIGMPSRIG